MSGKALIFTSPRDPDDAWQRAHRLRDFIIEQSPTTGVEVINRLKTTLEIIEIVVQYRVVQTPTFVFLSADGATRWRQSGLPSEEELKLILTSIDGT